MTADQLFSICNTTALLAWILMIALPRWRGTQLVVLSGLMPLMLGLVYIPLIAMTFGSTTGDFSSLAGVKALFGNDYLLVAGWVHYLAFDMFVGSWILSNGQQHKIHHMLLIPCLFFTFMFGPAGLILYFIIRSIKSKQLLHDNFKLA
ncbi:MAG TPA: ABA4-like family protein [Cyclobacteriaceae bacterium]|nr:ABA4-like family protein [Cyclobacteriaceae bacterium]